MTEKKIFRNRYACPCGTLWTDEWSATCDDRCPECDTSCSPYSSEEIAERRSVPDARNRQDRFAWRDGDIEIHGPNESQSDSGVTWTH